MGLFDNLFGKKEEFFLELGESQGQVPAEAPKAEAPAAAAAPVAAKPAAAPVAKAAAPAAAAKPAVEAPLAPPVEVVNFATEYVGVASRTPRRRPGVAMSEFLELAQSVGQR